MIYFIQSAAGGPIKIGTTKMVGVRLGSLRSSLKKPDLKVLAVMEGSYAKERALHRKFSDLDTGAEWYSPGAKLRAFIEKHGQPWDGSSGSESVQVRIPLDLYAVLTKVAEQNHRSRGAELVISLTEYLASRGLWPPSPPAS